MFCQKITNFLPECRESAMPPPPLPHVTLSFPLAQLFPSMYLFLAVKELINVLFCLSNVSAGFVTLSLLKIDSATEDSVRVRSVMKSYVV